MLDELVADLDYPMWVVTVAAAGERDGCLVGFASQCSIDPFRFAVWLSVKNRTYRLAREADTLVVHRLPKDAMDLAELFGGTTADEEDKLAKCQWRPGPDGAPVLDGAAGWFAGRIVDRIEMKDADHVGFVIEPLDAEMRHHGPALSFQQARGIDPGHEA